MPHLAAVGLALLAAAAVGVGCGKPSADAEAQQWQAPPPDKDVPIPAGLSIAVVVDGVPQPPITAAVLHAARPDYADAERQAWRIPTLVPAAAKPGTVEATSPAGVSVTFAHPTAEGLEPVLFLTRRGEIIAAAVDPKDPFPRYHGQGGRLHRAGDQMPRVAPVSKLEITRSTP